MENPEEAGAHTAHPSPPALQSKACREKELRATMGKFKEVHEFMS